MDEKSEIKVHCYSGHKADERPVSFEWLGVHHTVGAILDRWYGPDYRYFKVRASSGGVFLLKYDEVGDTWEIEQVVRS